MPEGQTILCVQRDALPYAMVPCGRWTTDDGRGTFGFQPERLLGRLERHGGLVWLPRTPELEQDESLVQLVACVIVRDLSGRVLCYRRSKKSGEGRLHDRWTCIVGGHVEEQDRITGNLSLTLDRAAEREAREEIGWEGPLSLVGWIRDTRDPVGRVHLGVVYEATCSSAGSPRVGPEVAELAFLEPDAARALEGQEGWSQLALDYHVGKQVPAIA